MGCRHGNLVCPPDTDGNECTANLCQTNVGCKSVPTTDLLCTATGVCVDQSTCTAQGKCEPVSIQPCPDDGNPCTSETCEKQGPLSQWACVHPAVAGSCDDGSPCTKNDACTGGKCGGAAKCDDGNPCTTDSCDAATGACSNAANSDPCASDDNVCTDEKCAAGACTHPNNTVTCDVGACTDDICAGGKCTVGPANGSTGPCEDGEPCTTGDKCAAGVCTPGIADNCFDYNDCTADSCVTGKGCVHTPESNASSCNFGCTIGTDAGCTDCGGGHGCFKSAGHYCGNPAGEYKGTCIP